MKFYMQKVKQWVAITEVVVVSRLSTSLLSWDRSNDGKTSLFCWMYMLWGKTKWLRSPHTPVIGWPPLLPHCHSLAGEGGIWRAGSLSGDQSGAWSEPAAGGSWSHDAVESCLQQIHSNTISRGVFITQYLLYVYIHVVFYTCWHINH